MASTEATQMDEGCFAATIELSTFQVSGFMNPRDFLDVLIAGRIDFVVLGLYGISGWLKEPRATQDLDVLVSKRQHRRAVAVVREAFPGLTVADTPVATRFLKGKHAVLDVIKAYHPLFSDAFKNAVHQLVGGKKVSVPDLEMALALKFFSMTSPGRRQADQFQDAHDFINMVESNQAPDFRKLFELGDKAYAGGGRELEKMVKDVRAGRRLEL